MEQLTDFQGVHILGDVGQLHIVVDQDAALAEAVNADFLVPILQLGSFRIDFIELEKGKERDLSTLYHLLQEIPYLCLQLVSQVLPLNGVVVEQLWFPGHAIDDLDCGRQIAVGGAVTRFRGSRCRRRRCACRSAGGAASAARSTGRQQILKVYGLGVQLVDGEGSSRRRWPACELSGGPSGRTLLDHHLR